MGWHSLAACALRECGPCTSRIEAKKSIVQAIDVVAKRLGNTRAVCRACYVHPTVLDAYLDCSLCTLSFPTDMSICASRRQGCTQRKR